jgi:hypothetical protein
MTIERFTFTPPLNVSKVTDIKLEDALLFAKKREVPPGYKVDVTPSGYRDKYILSTVSVNKADIEDTVGQIEVTNMKNYAKAKLDIDENTPICVIARPNVLDGGTGVRIDEVIRYTPSNGLLYEDSETQSEPIPIKIPDYSIGLEEAIPIELPLQPEKATIPLEFPTENPFR